MTPPRETIERDLRALAAEAEWPPTPDLVAAVRARLAREGDPVPPPHGAASRPQLRLLRSPLAVAAVALLALLVAVALVPPARSALLRVLGLTHGARILRIEHPPQVSRGPLDLGRPMPLSRARRRLAFAVRLPAALGPPGRTRYSARIAGGAVTLSWPGYVMTEFEGRGVPFLKKIVTRGTRVRRLRIAGAPAYFLSGAPHELVVADRNGQPLLGERALVHGNVLLWDAGGLSFRLETRHGLADARRVALSVPSG